MKRLALVILALCGCSSNPPPAAPAAAQPDCNAVVATTARLLAAHQAPAAEAERIKGSIALHCVEDQWTVAATACVGGAKDMEAAHTCLRETLTVAQHEKIMSVLQGATPAAQHEDKPSEPVSGTSQAEIAAQRNAEGKELMFKNDFAAASMRFRDAVARAPEAKYYFNLCISVFSEGKLNEALSACQGALDHQPDAALRGKIERTMVTVKNEAKKQGVNLNN